MGTNAISEDIDSSKSNRKELHKSIWQIADKLRGTMTANSFQSFVLNTLFYRYLSEDFSKKLNSIPEIQEFGGIDLYDPEWFEGLDIMDLYNNVDTIRLLQTIGQAFYDLDLNDERLEDVDFLNHVQELVLEKIDFFLSPKAIFGNVVEYFAQDGAPYTEHCLEFFKNALFEIEHSSNPFPVGLIPGCTFPTILFPIDEHGNCQTDLQREFGFGYKEALYDPSRGASSNRFNLLISKQQKSRAKYNSRVADMFQGIFSNQDFNLGLEKNKLGRNHADITRRIRDLLKGIASMDLGAETLRETRNDPFGDAYEFMIGKYASNAGQSGGEYFTPQEVSRLISKIAISVFNRSQPPKLQNSFKTVYDPACGSGSLLLHLAREAKININSKIFEGFCGQELNHATCNLARMNLILHGVSPEKFFIGQGDTLINPCPEIQYGTKSIQYQEMVPNPANQIKGFPTKPIFADHEKTRDGGFDIAVSNPPYSISWVPSQLNEHEAKENAIRFPIIAPDKKADLAFVTHTVSYLNRQGVAAIVCFPGVMYRGSKEQHIREILVKRNLVDGVIQLPDNLFYGTTIATCILILDRNREAHPEEYKDIVFVDASRKGMKGESGNNVLKDEDIQEIFDMYTRREYRQCQVAVVGVDRIKKSKYNLACSAYVEPSDTRTVINIEEVNRELDELFVEQQRIREDIKRLINIIEGKEKP